MIVLVRTELIFYFHTMLGDKILQNEKNVFQADDHQFLVKFSSFLLSFLKKNILPFFFAFRLQINLL